MPKNRLFLLFIVALFVMPLAAAWWLVGWMPPVPTSQHGQLLIPAHPITHLAAQQIQLSTGSTTPPVATATSLEMRSITAEVLTRRWTLLYINHQADCDERCQNSLYNIRQIRLALGKDMDRIQTWLFLPQEPDATLLKGLHRTHPMLTVAVVDTDQLAQFVRPFSPPGALGEWIYAIDPLGNLFMRYAADSPAKGILEDLRRLLKISKIG